MLTCDDPAPVIPFTFSMNNHLAAFPTSLGAGVHTPFDYSTHAWINYIDNKVRIRLVDVVNARVVTFVQTAVGSATFSDGTDLFREARFVGGTTLQGSTHIEIESHDRTILKFQLYESTEDTDPVVDRAGRLVSWKNLANRGYA